MVVFTIVIAGAAIGQALIYRQMLKTAGITERAWINLETLHLENFDKPDTVQQPRAVIGLKNSGHTPAFITRAKVILLTTPPLPETPPYDLARWAGVEQGPPPSILVAGEKTNWRYLFPNAVKPEEYRDIQTLSLDGKAWIFGVVEYRDSFGRDHRYGFARVYDPWLQEKHAGDRFAHVHNPNYSYAD